MKRLTLILVILVVGLARLGRAGEIGFIEDFALAADRTLALKQLIPGTEEYYFFHCLHLQNSGQFAEVDEMLVAWIKRHKYTPLVNQIRLRQALLTYAQSPTKSLAFLRKELNLRFAHQRQQLGAQPNLPSQLDPDRISHEAYLKQAQATHQNLQGFEDTALDWLVDADLNPDRRRHLLERLQHPDYENLAELVIDDLNYKNSKGFGSFAIHHQLLPAQLAKCLQLKPNLLNQTNFVNISLSKLHPNPDVDWIHDEKEHAAFLDRLWSFARRLAPVHNSLKAHVLYHYLDFERSQGTYDLDRLMTYIRLPRNTGYMNVKYMRLDENRRHVANLNQNYSGATLLPAIGDDEPLVRDFLHHYFVEAKSYDNFEPYIRDGYLKRQFAETKIVNGIGDPERWFSMLSPEVYKALKERVDLDFAATNNKVFRTNDEVSLDLHVKNVSTLIVKVYNINADNYYRKQQREVNTDINLDGLVANWEATYEYDEPALRRVKRHFDFPDLDRPGVYVVDFIGNGKSSRLVVRKGKLRYLVHTTSAGHEFTVLNEENQKLQGAKLWMAGREYTANDAGRIIVPYSNQPGRQAIILSQGEFSSLAYFQHASENYSLQAGIHIDREALLKQNKAQVLIRSLLRLNGIPISLSLLDDVELVIHSTDHDGVSTSKKVTDVELFEDREYLYEFQVPQRLAQISFTIQAKVKHLSQNKDVPLSATKSFTTNQIDRTEKIEDLHFSKINGEYIVELLGKTGEPRDNRAVPLTFKHRDFRQSIDVTLKTDAEGRIYLGRLRDITAISGVTSEGVNRSWQPPRDVHTYSRSLHAAEGETIQLPYTGLMNGVRRNEFALLELRGNTFVADRFGALRVDAGMIEITGLPHGDYRFILKRDRQQIALRITKGEVEANYTLGSKRYLEVRGQQPMHITSVSSQEDDISIQLRNADQFTRVHVFATRYLPVYSAYGNMAVIRDHEPRRQGVRQLESLYAEGRNIGDEYRYILDRRYAKKYPGNMLDRPSVLLNPWAIRDTETGEIVGGEGAAFGAMAEDAADAEARAESARESMGQAGEFSNLDFLGQASTVVLNIVPDEQGVISISRDEVGPNQHLHVVAVSPLQTAYRSISLPEQKSEFRDLRLLSGLDPEAHFSQQKSISVVATNEVFELPDITSSRFEAYDSLSSVYSLFVTLSNDPHLTKFSFILDWPQLTPEQKRANFSQHACHELSFFLFKKDPEFFAEVVQPFLGNKQDKTFLDQWLVEADLASQLAPWSYGQLNAVERILLSQRIAAERQFTSRHINDLANLLPPDLDRFNVLFETAVKSSALDTEDALNFHAAVDLALGEKQLAAMDRLLGEAEESEIESGTLAPGGPAAPPAQANGKRKQSNRANAASAVARLRNQMKKLADKETDGSLEFRGRQRDGGFAGGGGGFFGGGADGTRKDQRQLYQELDKTQEWVENNYYQRPLAEQNASLVAANAFWSDYAKYVQEAAGDEPFFSPHYAEATANFTEMMFALSVLDFPFKSEEHETDFDQATMRLTARSPLIVVHEEIKPAGEIVEQTPILVSQNFFRHDDRYHHEGNQRLDKFVTDEFLVGEVYGCQVAVTNPTSSPQKLDVLLQIPVGALAVLGHKSTRSMLIGLEPFSTETVEYYFYFPTSGRFPHYPVHVAKNEQLLAHAAPFGFNVVNELSQVDTESWAYVSQFGTVEEVIEFLTENNLHRIDLGKIAWRMRDKDVFDRVIPLLSARHAYNHTLWSYGIQHNSVAVIQQYLQHEDSLVSQCGDAIRSPLLEIDPVVRKTYEHRDYKPLVNSRAHQLGKRRQIPNDRFFEQYHDLMRVLSYRPALSDEDLLATTYYMLLQDRIEEAFQYFGRVNVVQLESRLQYDYFAAYLSFYTDDLQLARDLSEQYADYPIDRWRTAFANIRSQLDEWEDGEVGLVDAEDRTQNQTKLANTEPTFEFVVESKKVSIDYQNMETVRINYYLMDIELLFSTNPFVQEYGDQFSYIQPNGSEVIALPENAQTHEFELPGNLHNSNVLIEVAGHGQKKSQAYYANSLALQLVENYGHLKVSLKDDRQPLSKVYVKVYARMKDGTVRFYKDGYTDFRGRFDYVSLSTNEIDFVDKFSILVLSEDFGAVVREAAPPKQ
ncbi:MAG: hypothetical protein MK165_03055 [Pirellulaceae bacterium]|nr:hypothetical protein [Pirellulaceae bacterium]